MHRLPFAFSTYDGSTPRIAERIASTLREYDGTVKACDLARLRSECPHQQYGGIRGVPFMSPGSRVEYRNSRRAWEISAVNRPHVMVNSTAYPTGEVDAVWTDAPDRPPPSMFVSFASWKDPAHDPGPEKKYAGEIMVWSDWSTVEKWAGVPRGERGEDYRTFKAKVETMLLEQFAHYFPRLAELIVFQELSTPLATASITGHRMGSFYGLDVTPHRITTDALRMKTPIDGLYLTGQDVLTPGIPGAFWAGLLCAGSVDPRVFMHMKGP